MRLVLGPRYVLIAYSCSQLFDRLVCAKVAVDRTKPNGRVLGVDIIPAQPPKGVSTIQGNFLSTEVQEYVQDFLRDPWRGRPYQDGNLDGNRYMMPATGSEDLPRHALKAGNSGAGPKSDSELGTVDVVLSDMSAPWPQISGFWKRSLSQPYHRMMNTSGVSFRDHVRSMDLCQSALQFSYKALKTGGNFVCKFYQGAEDKELEKQLRELFRKVHRLKPESSRNESKEAYFIGLERRS